MIENLRKIPGAVLPASRAVADISGMACRRVGELLSLSQAPEKITRPDLERWAADALAAAKAAGFPAEECDALAAKLKVDALAGRPPEGMWFGWAHHEENAVSVYETNPSCLPVADLLKDMEAKGVGKGALLLAGVGLRLLPRRDFFELFNQSGMDHEVVGHLLNGRLGREHGEAAAVKAQVELARTRAKHGSAKWAAILTAMEKVLLAHKDEDIRIESGTTEAV